MGIGKFLQSEILRAANSKDSKIAINKAFGPWRRSSKDWQEEKRGMVGFLYEYYLGREDKE